MGTDQLQVAIADVAIALHENEQYGVNKLVS